MKGLLLRDLAPYGFPGGIGELVHEAPGYTVEGGHHHFVVDGTALVPGAVGIPAHVQEPFVNGVRQGELAVERAGPSGD